MAKENYYEKYKEAFASELHTLFEKIDDRQTEWTAKVFGLKMETEEERAIVRSVRATYEGFLLLGWKLQDAGKIKSGEYYAYDATIMFLTIVATKGMDVFKGKLPELTEAKIAKRLKNKEAGF